MEYAPLPPPPERTEEEIQLAMARIQRAKNIAKVTEVLRRHVPEGIMSDRRLLDITIQRWQDSWAVPLIDPNE